MKNYEKSNIILKSVMSTGFIVCFGKVLGFFKQAVIAWAFGSNGVTDSYFTADGFVSVIGAVISAAIVPTIVTEYVKLSQLSKKRADDLVRSSFLFFLIIGLMGTMLNVILSKPLSIVLGVSYSEPQRHQVEIYLVMLSPVILMSSIIGVFQGYFDSMNKFIFSRILGIFLSVSSILLIFACHAQAGTFSLFLGYIIGYIAYLCFLFVNIRKKMNLCPAPIIRNKDMLPVLKRILPLLVGNSIIDLGHIADKMIASTLAEGSVSALYYGQIISNDLINSVIVVVVGSAFLPSFTSNIVQGKSGFAKQAIKEIIFGVEVLLVFLLIFYLVNCLDLVRLVFERGSYNEKASALAAQVALGYAIGFPLLAVKEILAKAHYAFGDTFHPMLSNIVTLVLNVILSVIFSRRYNVFGISFATSVTMVIGCLFLMGSIRRYIGRITICKRDMREYCKILLAAFFTAIIGYFSHIAFKNLNGTVRFFLCTALMGSVYAACLYWVKSIVVVWLMQILQKRRKG